jgi:hypothetical protein
MGGLIETPAIGRTNLADEAWTAIDRRQWDVALARWASMREASPECPDGYVWSAHTLWLAGHLEAAIETVSAALVRFPENADALILDAKLAVTRADWAEAARRWKRASEVAPDRPDIAAGLATSLRLSGQLDAAETIVTAALHRHPHNTELMTESVWIAICRQHWPEAATRAQIARARLTELGRDSIEQGGVEHRIALHRHCSLAPEGDLPPATTPTEDRPAVENLMLAFESLGERCDFGLVQRHYGVEPFSLLRLTYVPYDGLVAALEARFEGIGDTDTEFECRDGELVAKVDRFGFVFHTFIGENELKSTETHQRFYRRWLRHLRNQLVSDLTSGHKFFVYGTADGMSELQMLRLFTLLRRYGPNRLLCVTPSTDRHPDGEVELISGSGLYRGYLGRFAEFTAGEQPSFDSWRLICELALSAAGGLAY